ncbi:alkaline phosphatase D family protein [Antrihabitans sp. YC2-6]|uniref:DUF7800 domain-containing protein n=1 Tax=Antrihabitans sp. YC2-6 TaxID=2799498 RepID=UPI001F3BB97B|nr:alkaline phosphatase D family protein [Antrihabitans sp. YC2-6]
MTTASLVVGPLLRYVDTTRATVWVETDRPCTVRILGQDAPTWTVHGHHYALVVIEGLQPGSVIPYTVALDDTQVWPEPATTFPPSVMRTFRDDDEFRLAFGSCRRSAPFDEAGLKQFGADALVGLANKMRDAPIEEWPDAIFLGGDQVYADTPSEALLERIRTAHEGKPEDWDEVRDEIGNFEEYTWLYSESWTPEPIRWLLSTVPTCMLLDDHDLRDDWNTSQTWRDWVTKQAWWPDRVRGAFASYWIYQHLGNLSPSELELDTTWAMVRMDISDAERSERLDAFAWRSDAEPDSARWSYYRDFGSEKLGIRMLAIDSRCSRRLDPDDRGIVDHVEREWLQEKATHPAEGQNFDHLIVASPLPFLVAKGIHHMEGWNEAVAGGAWGPNRGKRFGEWVRQEVDLEHWPAFRKSFGIVVDLLRTIAKFEHTPASVLVLSGDVHCSYTARATLPGIDPAVPALHQLTMSPFRNPLEPQIRFANRALKARGVRGFMHLLARSARVEDVDIDWDIDNGPWFENGVMTVVIRGRDAQVEVDHACVDNGVQGLRRTATIQLTGPPPPRRKLFRRRRT